MAGPWKPRDKFMMTMFAMRRGSGQRLSRNEFESPDPARREPATHYQQHLRARSRYECSAHDLTVRLGNVRMVRVRPVEGARGVLDSIRPVT
jgi:hypothetical protein